MYSIARTEINLQLRRLHDNFEEHYTKLMRAWGNARRWAETGKRPTRNESVLIPYVGSGLNRLSEGGLGSWENLVKLISTQTHSLGTPHQVKRSELSMPQQLEMHLRKAASDAKARCGKI